MSSMRPTKCPSSPRLPTNRELERQQHKQYARQQHHSWDEAKVITGTLPGLPAPPPQPLSTAATNTHTIKGTPTRTASSPLPPAYKCPKSPRSFHTQSSISHSYDSPTAPRSPSARSAYSTHSNYSDPVGGRSARGSHGSYDNPPRSPKITTTYAPDSGDEQTPVSTPSYYQTPTSGSRTPKGASSSHENSLDSASGSSVFLSGHGGLTGGESPRRNAKSPCKFVFDAISPEQTTKKFEYYEPISPDDGNGMEASGGGLHGSGGSASSSSDGHYFEPSTSPQIYEPRRQLSKKYTRPPPVEKPQSANANEWEMSLVAPPMDCFYAKRDSCVTESTQLSMESNDTNNSSTATTSFSYSTDHSKPPHSEHSSNSSGHAAAHNANAKRRRHAINITSNPGYQVLHSSHSTLDRTCSDSVVSLRYRKSTSDLTKDAELTESVNKHENGVNGSGGGHKPRRRGSSKGGLAYLASRRSSRESMKSACSNTSIFSNDDIGPLAFQASTRGKQRRTSNFLELPVPDHIRPRVCSLPDRPYNPRASDDLYRLRHFSISKGNVVNCGDSIISRRSRSNTSVNSTNSRASERSPFEGSCCGGGYANVDSLPASPDDSEEVEPPPPPRYRVVMLGDAGVGKTALVNQFMTSEYMHTYDASLDDEFGEKTVSVLLDDEESEMVFIDHPSVEMSVENCLSTYEPHGCVVVFSVVDKSSFRVAEEIVNYLWQENYTKDKAVILVGNKADLARARVITAQDGKALAASRDAKFIETSSGIQHNVDELLVGILKQTRLKETREKKATSSKMKTSRTHISLHLAKEILQKICLSDISKSKSCENLHVL